MRLPLLLTTLQNLRAASFRKIFFSAAKPTKENLCGIRFVLFGKNRKSDSGQNRIFAKAKKRSFRNDNSFQSLKGSKLFLNNILFLAGALSLAACASQSTSTGGKSGQGYYKVGQPYVIDGHVYTPSEDYSYDETGIASWYGDAFHDGTTANGEIFNKNELTAAHKTLPLPTLARITNLDNGRSIVVRINDRGPFSGARIIDVSQRAAQLLGFEQQGTAKVRVQVLADESKAIADAMRHYGSQ